jgi:hypothetical protein
MSEIPKGTRPTHELKLLDMETEDTAQVGVAWARDGGYVSIKLNPGVTLSYDNMKGKVLTLFKARTKEEWEEWLASRQSQPQGTPKVGYDGEGGNWKKSHPDYVRKVHFTPATRQQCAQRAMGKPELSDDPSKVTCKRCKELAQRAASHGASVTTLPVQMQEPPKEPTPAA